MAVIKILKETESNIDSNDIWRFSFHSNFPTWKIAYSGHGTITIPAGSWATWHSADIIHNLGYKPFFTARVEKDGKSYRIYGTKDPGIGLITRATMVDNNKLTISIFSGLLEPEEDVIYNISWTIMYDQQ